MNPMFQQLQKQAERDELNAVTLQVQGDQASLLARYGTRLAMANPNATTPVMSPSYKVA